jgi:hypothetical protein
MRPRRLIVALALTGIACRDPRAEANIAQAMTEVGTTISLMQQDYTELQDRVDSLRQVVAKQDTVIRQLATLAGVPMR